jgi:hypothetical protein
VLLCAPVVRHLHAVCCWDTAIKQLMGEMAAAKLVMSSRGFCLV